MRCSPAASLVLLGALQCAHVPCCTCAHADGPPLAAWCSAQAAPRSRPTQLQLRGGSTTTKRQERTSADKRAKRQGEDEAAEAETRKKREPPDAASKSDRGDKGIRHQAAQNKVKRREQARTADEAEPVREAGGQDSIKTGTPGQKGEEGESGQTDEEIAAQKRREKRKRDKLNKKQRLKEKKKEKAPFRPWADTPAKGETLTPNLAVYDCWFPLKVEWPALTFDIMEDAMGKRKGFPFATSIVAGGRACEPRDESVGGWVGGRVAGGVDGGGC